MIFRTEDVDGACVKVRASGEEVLQEPTDQFYGVCGTAPSATPLAT